MDLQEIREKIDEIDEQIVALFEQRMECSKEVAEYKIKVGKKVFDKEREQKKLESVQTLVGQSYNKHGIYELYSQIMSMSRKLQYSMMKEKEKESFQEAAELDLDGKNIICFGDPGSYTEQAAEEYFETKTNYLYGNTFKEVMETLKDERADFGVLPIENSSTGGITDIYDLLLDYENTIIGEHIIKVEQALMGLKGAKIEELERVYSHPQGILQCNKFLESYPNLKPIEFLSTSASARKVASDGDMKQGAIASVRAARQYQLEILEESINKESNNSTRFIVISREKYFLKSANKISICFELPHRSGTLYNMLSHFIYNNLNMTKIESRPIPGRTWEYRFFVEFEGNMKSPSVKNALRGIKEEAENFRILGNFLTK